MSPVPRLPTLKFHTYMLLLALGWTLAVGVMVGSEIQEEREQTLSIARAEALTNINKDLAYRRWVTSVGGVYVPIHTGVAPNPYLQVPYRDLTTTTDLTLTLLNPAYMTRLVVELTQADYGWRTHLTSLQPLRPANAADAWETAALQAFENGAQEVSAVTTRNDADYFRLMVPFITEPGCLACHGAQNYRVGEVRGGISVAIPLAHYTAMEQAAQSTSLINYGLLWLLGLGGLYFVTGALHRRVAEREQALRQMSESNERFRALVYSLNDLVYTLDDQQHLTGGYGPWAARTGHPPATLLGKTVPEVLGGAAPAHQTAHQRALAGEVTTYEWEAAHPTPPRHYQTIVSPLHDAAGQIRGVVGVARDITAPKQVEAALRASEEKWRRLFDILPVGVALLNQQRAVTDMNPALKKIVGFTEAELANGSYRHRTYLRADQTPLPPEDFPSMRAIQTQRPVLNVQVGVVKETGQTIWTEVSAAPLTVGETACVVVTTDITERKHTEKALTDHLLLLGNIIDASVDMIFVKDRALRTILCNTVFAQAIGKTPAETYGKTDIENGWAPELVLGNPAQGLRGFAADDQEALQGHTVHNPSDLGNVGGTVRYFDTIKQPVRDTNGEIVGVLGISRDITDRQRAENALRESETRWRTIAESYPNAYLSIIEQDLRVSFSAGQEFKKQNLDPNQFTGRALEQVFGAQAPVVREHYLQTFAGVAQTFELTVGAQQQLYRTVPLTAPDGTIPRILSVAENITERKQAEAALRESENRFRAIFEQAAVGVAQLDSHTGAFVRVNQKYCEIVGYTAAELTSATFLQITHADDLLLDLENMRRLRAGAIRAFSMEKRYWCKDGSLVWVNLTVSPLWQPGEPPDYHIAVVEDITQRKQAEAALRASEARFRNIIERSPIPFALNDDQQNITYLNAAFTRTFGYTLAEIPTLSAWWPRAYPDPAYRQWVTETWARHLEQAQHLGQPFEPLELRIQCQDGSQRTVLASAEALADTYAGVHLVIFYDITERQQAEAALRASERKLRLIFDTLHEGIALNEMVFDATGAMVDYRVIEVNRAFYQMADYQGDVVVGTLASQLYGMSPEVINTFWHTHRQHQGVQHTEFYSPLRHQYFFISTSPFTEGKFVTSFFDITERKRAEDALRENTLLLQEAQRVAHLGHYVFTRATSRWTSSPMLDLVFGIGPDYPHDIDGWLALVHPAERATMREYFIEQVLAQNVPFDREYRIQRAADGVERWMHGLGQVEHGPNGELVRLFGVIQDITERKQAQAQLEQALAEKETLLRELYHRTKNNMQVISALLELQAAEINDPRLETAFADTQSRIHSMALVHQKLYEAQDLSHINLKDYITDLLGLLVPSYRLKGRLALVTELESVEVLIDTAIPCGLILNELISNALKYAFPSAPLGTLTVQLRRTPAGDIHLRVADDGVGFPPGFDVRRDGHLGLQNVVSLGERQLRGQVTFATANGVACELQFRDDLYQARV